MKWQNLRDGRCPVCGNILKDGVGPYMILVCTSSECTFRIREDNLLEILRNKNHAANLYARDGRAPSMTLNQWLDKHSSELSV